MMTMMNYSLKKILIILLLTLGVSASAETFDWNKHQVEQTYLNQARSLVRNFLSGANHSEKDRFELNISITTQHDLVKSSIANKGLSFLPMPMVTVPSSGGVEISKIKFDLYVFSPLPEAKIKQVQSILKKYFGPSSVDVVVSYQVGFKKPVPNLTDLAEKKKVVIYNQLSRSFKEYFNGEVRFDLFVSLTKNKTNETVNVEMITYKKIDKEIERNVSKIASTFFPDAVFDFKFQTLLSPVELEKARLEREKLILKQKEKLNFEKLAKIEAFAKQKRELYYSLYFWMFVMAMIMASSRFNSIDIFFKILKNGYKNIIYKVDKAHVEQVKKSLDKDFKVANAIIDSHTSSNNSKKVDLVFNEIFEELEFHTYQNKELVAKNLSCSYEDLKGIKTLIESSPKVGRKLAELLSFEASTKLLDVKTVYSENEFKEWLQFLLNKFRAVSIKSSTFFQRAIGLDTWIKLESIPFDILVSSALKQKSINVNKVLISFLPTQESTKLMDSFSDQMWSAFLSDEAINVAELNKEMTQFLDLCSFEFRFRFSEDVGKEKVIPLLDLVLQRKNQKEAKDFIERISLSSHSLGQYLKQNFWTEDKLLDIPEIYLTKKLKDYDQKSLCLVFLGISLPVREKMLNCLGLIEKVKMQEALNDLQIITDSSLEQSSNLALRNFLTDLKNEFSKGQYHFVNSKLNIEAKAA